MNTKDETFQVEFLSNYNNLVKFAKRIAGGSEDLVHQVFVKYKEDPTVEVGNFKTFMMQSIKNLAFSNFAKANGRTKDQNGKFTVNSFTGSDAIDLMVSTQDMEEEAFLSERKRQLESFARKLPEEQSRIFLAVLGGQSLLQYVEEHGKNYEAVKGAYRQSYSKAREYFRE